MARRRRSIWQFRSSAIKTTSRLIVALASFANGARQTPLPIKAVVYAKDFYRRRRCDRGFWRSGPEGSVKRSLMEWRTDGDTAYRSKANEEFICGKERFRQPCPSQEAEGPLHAEGSLAGEQRQIKSPD